MGFPDSPDGIPSSVVDSTLNFTAALHADPTSVHRPSMLLDAERGRPIEVEVILGEVVRMAKENGVSIPVSFLSSFWFLFPKSISGFAFCVCMC
jgi:2-dehydropantoate 2-reductase